MRIRQYVYFALSSRHTSAEEIATLLGIEPDEVTVRASRRTEPAIPVHHSWKIVCREPDLSVNEQVFRVLDRLRPHTHRIAELAQRLRAEDEEHGGAILEVVRYLNDEEDLQLNQPDARPSEMPDEPNLLGWHLNHDLLDFLTATGAVLDVDEYDMTPEEPGPTQVQAERDALHRELGDLRAWLSQKLDLIHREPGPQGITVLKIASDREILAEIERLRVEVAALRQPEDAPARRWLEIDELILGRTQKIQALTKIRELFGCGLREAVDLLEERYQTLRHQRPNGFTEDHHEQEQDPLPAPDNQQADNTDSDNGLA